MYRQILNQMIIKCVGCKTDIVMDHPNKRLCAVCRKTRAEKKKEYNKKYLRDKYTPKRTEIICKICGKKYVMKNKTAKYCSNSCRSKGFYGKRNIQRWEKRITVLEKKIADMREKI